MNSKREIVAEITDDSEHVHALANMLVDIDISSASNADGIKVNALKKALSGLQPQREVPNKNRGKRFAAGELSLDKSTETDHQVEDLQFGHSIQQKRLL